MAGINQIKPVKKRKARKKNTEPMALEDAWLSSIIDEHLEELVPPKDGGVFHPSALGNTCDRYLWLYYNGRLPEEFLEARVIRIFQNGNFLEERVDKWFTELNILIDREISLKQIIPPISGRMDFLIKHYKYGALPVELKSINKKGFQALRKPKPEHTVQLQMYLNMGGYDKGTVLYECKDDQTIKTFLLDRDEVLWDKLLKRMFAVQDMLAMPEKCTGNIWCKCKGV